MCKGPSELTFDVFKNLAPSPNKMCFTGDNTKFSPKDTLYDTYKFK